MALEFTTSYIKDALSLFRYYKNLAEGAMAQLTDDQLLAVLDPEMNPIAIIVKHMTGNMRSRLPNFLTADGESASRNRDAEFEQPTASRAELTALWEQGWNCVFTELEPLTDNDLGRKITIRGEAHSVVQAINRQLAHYAYHTGQIVFIAKHFQHTSWKSLSVPRGQSQQFNRKVARGEASQR